MKKINILILMLVAYTAAIAQTVTVRGEELTDVDFNDYKSFNWASNVDSELDPGFYFLNDLVLKADTREAVMGELLGRGYQLNREDPDMIVNFRLFDKPVTLRGFQDLGDNYWTGTTLAGTNRPTEIEVKAGTLMVHLVDAKAGNVIWQGFASGLVDGNQFIKDEGKVREAVNMIFNEFGQRATEYSQN